MSDIVSHIDCHICKKEVVFQSKYGDIGSTGPYIELKHVAKGINNISSIYFHVECFMEQAGDDYRKALAVNDFDREKIREEFLSQKKLIQMDEIEKFRQNLINEVLKICIVE